MSSDEMKHRARLLNMNFAAYHLSAHAALGSIQFDWRSCYKRIYRWLKENEWRYEPRSENEATVYMQDGREVPWQGGPRTLDFIRSMVSPSKISRNDAKHTFDEVVSGQLEWTYWQHDGLFVMHQYALEGMRQVN